MPVLVTGIQPPRVCAARERLKRSESCAPQTRRTGFL
jgi:hypothetical protein